MIIVGDGYICVLKRSLFGVFRGSFYENINNNVLTL